MKLDALTDFLFRLSLRSGFSISAKNLIVRRMCWQTGMSHWVLRDEVKAWLDDCCAGPWRLREPHGFALIPERWSLEFARKSDLAMFCIAFPVS